MADDPIPSEAESPDISTAAQEAVATAAIAAGDVILRADGTRVSSAAARVQKYDFRNPSFLSEMEMRRLRLLHEDFVRYLAARISLYLRMEFGLKLASLSTSSYSNFTEGLPNPSHLNLFKVEPLVGVGILDINPRLALTAADRLLGGRGQAIKADRDLTEIEISLIEDLVLIILEEWGSQWKSERELKPALLGHETNGRFLQTSPKDAIVLVLVLEATLGDCAEKIQIGVPYYTVEPLVKQLQVRRQKEEAISTTAKNPTWHGAYNGIKLPVRAEWSAFELSIREVAHLRVGDVIEMPPAIFSETQVLINGSPKFIGTVGLDTDHVAVQLNRKIPAQTHSPHA